MRLTIAAIGRMRAGPERALLDHYTLNAGRMGKALGFAGPDIKELDEARERDAPTRMAREAQALLGAVPDGAALIMLDETGSTLTSAGFAQLLENLRDRGTRHCVLAVGGADGHGEAVRARADHALSLGAMTWPHLLARAMLAEQIYRAMTILSGHPYHRG